MFDILFKLSYHYVRHFFRGLGSRNDSVVPWIFRVGTKKFFILNFSFFIQNFLP